MSRPTDWWVIDLEGDPTPGSPAAIRRMAPAWSDVADLPPGGYAGAGAGLVPNEGSR